MPATVNKNSTYREIDAAMSMLSLLRFLGIKNANPDDLWVDYMTKLASEIATS